MSPDDKADRAMEVSERALQVAERALERATEAYLANPCRDTARSMEIHEARWRLAAVNTMRETMERDRPWFVYGFTALTMAAILGMMIWMGVHR